MAAADVLPDAHAANDATFAPPETIAAFASIDENSGPSPSTKEPGGELLVASAVVVVHGRHTELTRSSSPFAKLLISWTIAIVALVRQEYIGQSVSCVPHTFPALPPFDTPVLAELLAPECIRDLVQAGAHSVPCDTCTQTE